jgi:hypothetical protein
MPEPRWWGEAMHIAQVLYASISVEEGSLQQPVVFRATMSGTLTTRDTPLFLPLPKPSLADTTTSIPP